MTEGDLVDDRPDRVQITRPKAVELLTDLRGLKMLTPFFTTAHTLTTAARSIGRPPSSLAHWVPRFVAAGLLERCGEIRRAGAPMPRYRTPAPMLVVPFAMLPFDARVRMLDEGRMRILRRFFDGMDEALAASATTGLSFAAYGDSGTIIDLDEPDGERAGRAFTDGWYTLELDDADALSLARELEDLLRRYSAKRGRRQYVAHGGVAPDPQFRWRSAPDGRRA